MQVCVIQSILIHSGLDSAGCELRVIWGLFCCSQHLQAESVKEYWDQSFHCVLHCVRFGETGGFSSRCTSSLCIVLLTVMLHCLKNCTNVCIQIMYHSKGYVSMVCVFILGHNGRQWKRKTNSTAPVSVLLCPFYRWDIRGSGTLGSLLGTKQLSKRAEISTLSSASNYFSFSLNVSPAPSNLLSAVSSTVVPGISL